MIYSNGATIGVVAINKISVATKQGILGIVPNEKILTEFLYYVMNSICFKQEIHRITTRGTMYTAYLKDVNKIKVYCPVIDIQKNIVVILSLLDLNVELQTQKLNLLQKYKQGLVQKMFV